MCYEIMKLLPIKWQAIEQSQSKKIELFTLSGGGREGRTVLAEHFSTTLNVWWWYVYFAAIEYCLGKGINTAILLCSQASVGDMYRYQKKIIWPEYAYFIDLCFHLD